MRHEDVPPGNQGAVGKRRKLRGHECTKGKLCREQTRSRHLISGAPQQHCNIRSEPRFRNQSKGLGIEDDSACVLSQWSPEKDVLEIPFRRVGVFEALQFDNASRCGSNGENRKYLRVIFNRAFRLKRGERPRAPDQLYFPEKGPYYHMGRTIKRIVPVCIFPPFPGLSQTPGSLLEVLCSCADPLMLMQMQPHVEIPTGLHP